MALADMLPTFDDAALLNLQSNAVRLAADTDGARHEDAAALLPLIEAELSTREATRPPKAVRRAPPKAPVRSS